MKDILLTGASGFLGKIISEHLGSFEIITLGRDVTSDVICDLALEIPVLPVVDLIIHAAGKAHFVPKTETEKRDFYDVNVTGTHNLLKGLEKAPHLPKYFVLISSVAVYGKESGEFIDEDSPLDAKDPYGHSKIQAEKMVENWCKKRGITYTILRLPLLAGPHPPGNLKAMIRGIDKGYYFNIAGGGAKKSIVLAADVARIIPGAAKIGGIYNLTDGVNPSFTELSALIALQTGKSKPSNMPLLLASVISKIGDLLGKKAPLNSKKLEKIISDLTFDDRKAVRILNWRPNPVLKEFKIK